ncbi:MAG: hypothetical protein ABI406_17005 [Ktedonobacteraceae bacterium]
MNMSEFDGQLDWEDAGSSPISISGHNVPDDFSDEDMSFAQELGSLFDVEQENLPPYFVQTLLDSENPRFQPVEQGFEHKARARVFRRLKLKRRLFGKNHFSPATVVAGLPARRPLMAFGMALMLFMLMTIVITGPSFASGLEILLSGGNVGILATHELPPISAPSTKTHGLSDSSAPDSGPKQLSLTAAQLQLHFAMNWPIAVPDSYNLYSISLYQNSQRRWMDGPSIGFVYKLPANMIRSTGLLTVDEFKLDPSVKVLQVVKDGAAQPVGVAQNGQATAIYVDGQWVLHNNDHADWVYGQRSELIYQHDGIIFWIVGDQIDGMNESTLLNIANSLQPVDINLAMHDGLLSHLNYVNILDGDDRGPFSGDVLAVSSGDGPIGPYLSFVGASSNQPTTSKPVHQSLPPLHLLRPDSPR